MNIHFIILVLLLTAGLFFFKSARSRTAIRRYLVFCCFLLILDSGLRNVAVGADTYAYYLKYENVSQMTWQEVGNTFVEVYINKEGKDAGYYILQKAMSSLGIGFQLFLVIVASLFFLSLGLLLDKFDLTLDEIYIAFLIYLSLFYDFFSTTGIRQTISVALGILSFLSLLNKNYLRYLLLVILAFFIHKSALILLLLPILRIVKSNYLVIVSSMAGFIVFAVYRDFFVGFFRDLAEYEEYVAARPIALMVFLFLLSLLCMYSLFKARQHEIRVLIRSYLPTFMWIPVLGNDSLFMRLIYYFSIYLCAALPYSLRSLDGRLKNGLSLSLIVFLIIHIIRSNTEYAFFWQAMSLGSNY